ncbi:MAG: hypothetical protein J6K33_03540 [Alistipes sp.]|nr:hypothetical protein [Alistipes sp.]
MGNADFRAELNELRKALTTEPTAELLQQALDCCVNIAEQSLQEQRYCWQNASLAREAMDYARQLMEHKDMLSVVESSLDDMVEAIYEHPRLKLELMLCRLEALQRLNKPQMELEADIAFYRSNIEAADSGRLEDIKQTTMLKHDPVEWTARWEEVIDEVDKIVDSRLEEHPRGMGFCHACWHERAAVLSEQFGIEWRSPARMNPRVLFD